MMLSFVWRVLERILVESVCARSNHYSLQKSEFPAASGKVSDPGGKVSDPMRDAKIAVCCYRCVLKSCVAAISRKSSDPGGKVSDPRRNVKNARVLLQLMCTVVVAGQ